MNSLYDLIIFLSGWKPNPVLEVDLSCVEDVCPNLYNETVRYGKWSCNPPVLVKFK